MPSSTRSRILRASLFLVSVAVGVVAVTLAGSPDTVRAASQAAVQTRSVSCAGFDFHPVSSGTIYTFTGRQIARTRPGGDGWFMCAAQLPHKAVVRKVRFTVNDSSPYISLEFCGLVRTSLRATGEVQPLGFAVSGTGMSNMPGIVRYSANSIDFATVDNANFAYTLQCQIVLHESVGSLGPAAGGIIGADITYTISAANG